MPKTTTFGGTVCQMHCCESLPPFLSLLLSPHLSLLKCSFFVLTSLPSLVYHSVWLSQPYKYLFFCLLFHYLEKLPIVISWVHNEHWTTNKYIYRLETILYVFVIFFFLTSRLFMNALNTGGLKMACNMTASLYMTPQDPCWDPCNCSLRVSFFNCNTAQY